MKAISKQIVVDAYRWWSNGDHPKDNVSPGEEKEGEVVRYFRDPEVPSYKLCRRCGHLYLLHGFIDSNPDGFVVCPGDYIVEDMSGNYFPCKPNVFDKLFCITKEQKIG